DLLATDTYAEINGWFDTLVTKAERRGKRREPAWHEPGPDGVQYQGTVATKLGARAEYISLYRYASLFAHGAYVHFGAKIKGESLVMEPVRRLEQFGHPFSFATSSILAAMLLVAREYLPEASAEIAERYVKKWKTAATT